MSNKGKRGELWENKCEVIKYDSVENGKVTITYHTKTESPPPTKETQAKIKRITAYASPLENVFWRNFPLEAVKNLKKHHFIVVESENRDIFSFEKNGKYIIRQQGENARTHRKEKPRLVSAIIVDKTFDVPSDKTVQDIQQWLDLEELKEPYRVFESNCQHFCQQLWGKFAQTPDTPNTPYPNPAKLAKERANQRGVNVGCWIGFVLTIFAFGCYIGLMCNHENFPPYFNVHLVHLPPTYEEGWSSTQQFPVGSDFIGGVVDNRLLLWGGVQKQPSGRIKLLPSNVVYSFTLNETFVETDLYVNGTWKVLSATGDVHPASYRAVSVSFNRTLFIFGGCKSIEKCVLDENDLLLDAESRSSAVSTLSATGEFKRLQPEYIPNRPEFYAGWTDGEGIYLIGRGELWQYSPGFNVFCNLVSNVPRPLHSVVVQIDHERIGFYGEPDEIETEKSFFVLDIKSKSFQFQHEIAEAETPFPIQMPSFFSMFPHMKLSQLVFVADPIKIFYVDSNQWEQKLPLPPEFYENVSCTKTCGLEGQQTFVIPKSQTDGTRGFYAVSVGGRVISSNVPDLPTSKMIVLNVREGNTFLVGEPAYTAFKLVSMSRTGGHV